jgi:hypothetical protein
MKVTCVNIRNLHRCRRSKGPLGDTTHCEIITLLHTAEGCTAVENVLPFGGADGQTYRHGLSVTRSFCAHRAKKLQIRNEMEFLRPAERQTCLAKRIMAIRKVFSFEILGLETRIYVHTLVTMFYIRFMRNSMVMKLVTFIQCLYLHNCRC